MPSPATENMIALLERGANPAYRNAYDRHYELQRDRLGRFVKLDVPSQKSIELMPYPLAQPHARHWPDGTAVPEGTAGSRSFTVVNRPWGIQVTLDELQVQLDQVEKALDGAKNAGKSIALLPERVAFQIMLGTTDKDLLPAVPNAADGAALYSATDGAGLDRFGVVGGNVYSAGGSSMANAASFIAAYFGAVGQAKQWQDGKGQPLWSPDVLEAGTVVIVGAHNELVANQARAQNFVFQTAGGAGAAPSNVFLDAKTKIDIWPTQRIAAGNDDGFVHFVGVEHKAIVHTRVQGTRYIFARPETSDWCRTWRKYLMFWDCVEGYGVGEAFSTIKIDN